MSETLQTILVLAIVAAAGGYVARTIHGMIARRKSSCGGCPACPASQEPQVVPLGDRRQDA